jgi:membrane associated rhomboid family serine protease
MIPYKDLEPTSTFPVVTLALIATNIAAFLWQNTDPHGGLAFAAVPRQVAAVLAGRGLWPVATLFTSAFLHGGLAHIGFNMLFLWIFGDNVEDRLGHLRYLFFYLAGAAVSGLSQVVASPHSLTPLVGASGAISAVLGAYLIFFPKAKVKALFFFVIIIQTVVLPAWLYLGVWFGTQVLSSLYANPNTPGVAWYAHIGGFLFGVYGALRARGERPRPAAARGRVI